VPSNYPLIPKPREQNKPRNGAQRLELWNLRVGFDESGAEKEDRKATGDRAEEGAIAGRAIGDEGESAPRRSVGGGGQEETSGFFLDRKI
jgi:hypothetical protein